MAAHKTANSFEFYHPHVTIAYRDDADALGASLAAGPCLERREESFGSGREWIDRGLALGPVRDLFKNL